MSRLPPPPDVLEAEPVVADELTLAPGAEPIPRTNWQLFRRRFLRHRLAVVSLVILVILFIACFGASWLAPYPRHPSAVDLLLGTSSGPSAKHWFGTDELGRDPALPVDPAPPADLAELPDPSPTADPLPDPPPADQSFHGIGEGVVGEILVGPHGVAAERRRLNARKQRVGRRPRHVGRCRNTSRPARRSGTRC